MEYTVRNIFESFLSLNRAKYPNVTVDEMLRTNFYTFDNNKITDVSIAEAMHADTNYVRIAYHLMTSSCNNFVGNSDIASLIYFLSQYMNDKCCFKYTITEEGIWLDVYHYNQPALSELVERFDTVLNSIANDVMCTKHPKDREEEILNQISALAKELEELHKL